MARPKDVEKSRDLAQRAVEVLERDGLTVSAEHLARELGIKRPTLLYHFPTHAHVVRHALTELLMEQSAFVAKRVDEHEHPIDRIYARMCAIHDFHRGKEQRILFLTQAIAVTAGTAATDILMGATALFDQARREMSERLERGIEDGIVEKHDTKALVNMARAVIDGLTIQRVVSPSSVRPVHEMFWQMVLLPLKKKKGKKS